MIPILAATGDRPPDVLITVSCDIDEGSFADVDSDGIDDLVMRSDGHVFSWPSSWGGGEPLVWSWGHEGMPYHIDVSTPNEGPTWVQWWGGQPDSIHEYTLDPKTLQLVEQGNGLDWYGIYHIGDIDGDEVPDLTVNFLENATVRASSTGVTTALPDFTDASGYYFAARVWGVGDIDHDGFDDLLVGQRQLESVDVGHDSDLKYWGPAQLYRGSPSGIVLEPLWTLYAPGYPLAGVGRGAAALPDERALVVTVVTEGVFVTDFSPERLGVIRDADTPDAYFDQLVQAPEFVPGGFTPYLYGWMDDGAGQQALTLLESPWGITWIPWHADGTGFHPNAAGVALPSRWWAPPLYSYLDGYLGFLSIPVGRHQQALLMGSASHEGYQFLAWGRTIAEIGPTEAGVEAAGCTFHAYDAAIGPPLTTEPPPGPDPQPEPAPEAPKPPPVVADPRCGCGTPHAGGIAAWLAVLAGTLRRRRPLRNRS